MNFFAKLAELSDGTISELKWIVLFLSCIAFFVSLLALKSSKENVLKAITYSSVVFLLLQHADLYILTFLIWYVN